MKNPQQPIFEEIFGEKWQSMPIVFHKHYANRPYCNDITKTIGIMNIEMVGLLKVFAPIFGFMKTLVPYAGKAIECKVNFESEAASNAFWFHREFHFPNHKPYLFRSKLLPQGRNKVIEYTKSGIGWVASYDFSENQVRLSHLGYIFNIFGQDIKLPLEWIFGESTAWEEAIDENRFRMKMEIRHQIFGIVYGYEGEFTVIGLPDA